MRKGLACLTGLVLAVPVGAMGEESTVALGFAWATETPRRVVSEWSLQIESPEGTTTLGGAIRERWRVVVDGEGWRLVPSDRVVVRIGDRRHALTLEMRDTLDTSWELSFGRDLALVRPVPRVDEVMEEAEPEEAEESVPIEEPGAAPEVVPEAPEEAVEGEEGEPAAPMVVSTVMSDDELMAMVVPARGEMLERLFSTFAGQTLPLDIDQRSNAAVTVAGTGEADVASVVRRASTMDWCPQLGPGHRCVTLELIRAYGGAQARADTLEIGQRREAETWLVAPDSLEVYRIDVVVDEVRTDETGAPWRYRASRTYRFLPDSAPTPPVEMTPAQ